MLSNNNNNNNNNINNRPINFIQTGLYIVYIVGFCMSILCAFIVYFASDNVTVKDFTTTTTTTTTTRSVLILHNMS